MLIFVTGVTGQIGSEIARLASGSGHRLIAPTREQCDLASADSVRTAVRAAAPDVIINTAAYTAVDRAEQEPALADAINASAPRVLAEEAARLRIPLLHFSTDYVFSGATRIPYRESDDVDPINVYGRSKLAGERAIAAAGGIYLILRTSWVYSRTGRNFLLTIERLARERPQLRIVDDQIGTPNWSRDLARAAMDLAVRPRDELSRQSGVYHVSSGGRTSWHGFARAIVDSLRMTNPPDVVPITTAEYPTPARRPAFSVLDASLIDRTFGVALPDWHEGLAGCQSSDR